jgi:hypothetical protein
LQGSFARAGKLTRKTIDADATLPSSSTCCRRLGDIMRLCNLVGCRPSRHQVNTYEGGNRRRAAAIPDQSRPAPTAI